MPVANHLNSFSKDLSTILVNGQQAQGTGSGGGWRIFIPIEPEVESGSSVPVTTIAIKDTGGPERDRTFSGNKYKSFDYQTAQIRVRAETYEKAGKKARELVAYLEGVSSRARFTLENHPAGFRSTYELIAAFTQPMFLETTQKNQFVFVFNLQCTRRSEKLTA